MLRGVCAIAGSNQPESNPPLAAPDSTSSNDCIYERARGSREEAAQAFYLRGLGRKAAHERAERAPQQQLQSTHGFHALGIHP